MAKNLDAERIEQAQHQGQRRSNRREEQKREIQDTIVKNCSGQRKGRVIMPEKKEYAYQEARKVRVAAYCRVSTAEEAQVGSFEMQVQHFQSVIDNNPNYELVKIYTDEGISGTYVGKRKGFQEMIEDACAGKINLLLTKSISRFGRNIVDILTTLRTLSDLNLPVEVNFESEGLTPVIAKTSCLYLFCRPWRNWKASRKALQSRKAYATECRRACINTL